MNGNPKISKKFNINRKIFHLIGLVFPIALELNEKNFFTLDTAYSLRVWILCFFILGMSLLFLVDTLRFRYSKLNSLFLKCFSFLLKEEEVSKYNASIAYFFSCILLFLFFTPPIIFLNCIFLMIADPIASYVGINYGKRKLFANKSLAGFFAFLTASFIFSLLYLWLRKLFFSNLDIFSLFILGKLNLFLLVCVFFGCVGASLAELFSVTSKRGLLDDNLFIPIGGTAGLMLGACFFPLTNFIQPIWVS